MQALTRELRSVDFFHNQLRPTDMVRKGGVPGWNPAGTLGWLFPGRRGSG